MKEVKFCFDFYNPNPLYEKDKSNHRGDCVIRAICAATKLDWYYVYDLLCAKGRELCDFGDRISVLQAAMPELGFNWTPIERLKRKKAMTVQDFIREYPSGTYILRLAHHLTAVVDGVCYDTWFPQSKTLYGYWSKIDNC